MAIFGKFAMKTWAVLIIFFALFFMTGKGFSGIWTFVKRNPAIIIFIVIAYILMRGDKK